LRVSAVFASALLGCTAPAAVVQAQEADVVQPDTAAIPMAALPAETTPAADSPRLRLVEHLDRQHDWLYRHLQRFLSGFDTRFSHTGEAALIVPVSPLRIGLDAEFLRGTRGLASSLRPDFEATLHLPNIERRFALFVSSADLPESGGDVASERNPVRAGIRFAARAHASLDIGVRVKFRPVAFAALRWAPHYQAGNLHFYPFIKPYVESGLGLGAAGGLTVEHWRGRWILRSAGYADWERRPSTTNWSQTLQVGHAQAMIREGRYDRLSAGHDLACGTLAHFTASGDHLGRAMAYEAGVTFKRPLHGGWLYGYAEPVVNWQRNSQWHPDAGIRIGLDALFWGLASLPDAIAGRCE
jgi:hypothetical protein